MATLSAGCAPSSPAPTDAASEAAADDVNDVNIVDAVDAGGADSGGDAGAVDAGGADSGGDAARVDAGLDAGLDAGFADSGSDAGQGDAGLDGGGVDVGVEVGVDAGRFDTGAAWRALTEGVNTLNLGSSLASAMVVHGETAFSVAYDANHVTFVAAAQAGAGRALTFGHESLVDNPRNTGDDRGRLTRNAVLWALRGDRAGVVGVEGARAELRSFLTEAGFTVRSATANDPTGLGVLITSAGSARTAEEAARLVAWVRNGGAVIVTGHAWYWGYSNRDPVTNFAGNRLTNPLGITITTDPDPTNNTAVPVRAPSWLDHARESLARIVEHVAGRSPASLAELVTASATVRRGVRFERLDSPYFDEVRRLRGQLPDVVPTSARPVRPASQPVEALTVTIDTRIAQDTPPEMLRAHPAAADFPGALAGSDSAAVTLAVNARYAGRTNRLGGNSDRAVWRSTGVWVPAGELVTVTAPDALVGRNIDLLVGSWTDDNTGTDAWSRMPVVTRSFALNAREVRVANAFGGLLYVRVPGGVNVGTVNITVTGGVRAPRFVLGETSVAAWRASRAAPGLYAELETPGVILTVPAALVRTLDDPTALLTWWQRVMDADADLASIDRNRPRAERIVFDRQIVAGYMHAGYPIMAFTPQAAEALDLTALARDGNWGFMHEIGHNHQFADWSFGGTGECTVNLWSLYAMEHTTARAPGTGHSAVTPAERNTRINSYIANGRNFTRDWSVWTCLDTFVQLQQGFGWSLFTRLNQEYMTLAESERPANESARIQRWVVRSSQLANRNLAPFYALWGWPLTDATRSATANLPAWAENPMR
ncbi:MAG: hypothetical protein JNK72_04635 [Myxococcales bacterium]|nr:hypothetical protein [Myxococcales bacterium]